MSTSIETAPDNPSTVETHVRHVVVWDVPSAVECGRRFRIRVGVRCVSACRPRDWRVELCDHDGNTLATTTLGDAPLPDTTALYQAEVELTAPETDGLHAWEARVPAIDREMVDDETPGAAEAAGARRILHDEARASFNVRAVPAPECRLTVVAIDRESQRPLEGARVVVHPYRALTDVHGIAEIRLPKGAYRLFVSDRDHFPFRSDGEVTGDLTIRAELDLDLGPSDAELWS